MKSLIPILLACSLFASAAVAGQDCCQAQAACCQPAQACCVDAAPSLEAQTTTEAPAEEVAEAGALTGEASEGPSTTVEDPQSCCEPAQPCCTDNAACCSG